MRFPVLLTLLIALLYLTGCRQPTGIVFPVSGAEVDNPVHLVASDAVTWFDGEQQLGVGTAWSGWLSPGDHEIRALSLGGTASLRLHVRLPFPIGKIVPAPNDFDPGQAPVGRYLRVWGKVFNSTISYAGNLNLLNAVVSSPHSRLAQGAPAQESPSGVRTRTVSEAIFSRTASLLASGRPSVCGDGCVEKPTKSIGALYAEPPLHRTFKVLNLTDYGYERVSSTLVGQGVHALAYIEDGQPQEVRDAVYSLFQAFDGHIHERVSTVFGGYSDVDGNGKVILLFTPRLNASGLAIGFFYPGDLFPASDDLPESNESEILYLGLPEDGDFNYSPASLEATACHELQHLVNFSHVTLPYAYEPSPPLSPVWLNEGLSHLAEDLCGYNTLGGNLAFVSRFLERPWTVSLTSTGVDGRGDSIERRGAAYLFLRYALERAGGVGFDAEGKLAGRGLSFTHALMSPDALTLDKVAAAATGVEDGERLLWRWWWTLAVASLRQAGLDVTERYPWAVYAPTLVDAVTGDMLGVDLFRGRVTIGEFTFSLEGLRYAGDCSIAALPVYGLCAEEQPRPLPDAPSSAGPVEVQIMRVE